MSERSKLLQIAQSGSWAGSKDDTQPKICATWRASSSTACMSQQGTWCAAVLESVPFFFRVCLFTVGVWCSFAGPSRTLTSRVSRFSLAGGADRQECARVKEAASCASSLGWHSVFAATTASAFSSPGEGSEPPAGLRSASSAFIQATGEAATGETTNEFWGLRFAAEIRELQLPRRTTLGGCLSRATVKKLAKLHHGAAQHVRRRAHDLRLYANERSFVELAGGTQRKRLGPTSRPSCLWGRQTAAVVICLAFSARGIHGRRRSRLRCLSLLSRVDDRRRTGEDAQ